MRAPETDTTFNQAATGNLFAAGPFPSPVQSSLQNLSVLTKHALSGQSVSYQVYTTLGIPVGSPLTVPSTAYWSKIELVTPSTPGAYYLRISQATDQITLPFVVY